MKPLTAAISESAPTSLRISPCRRERDERIRIPRYAIARYIKRKTNLYAHGGEESWEGAHCDIIRYHKRRSRDPLLLRQTVLSRPFISRDVIPPATTFPVHAVMRKDISTVATQFSTCTTTVYRDRMVTLGERSTKYLQYYLTFDILLCRKNHFSEKKKK